MTGGGNTGGGLAQIDNVLGQLQSVLGQIASTLSGTLGGQTSTGDTAHQNAGSTTAGNTAGSGNVANSENVAGGNAGGIDQISQLLQQIVSLLTKLMEQFGQTNQGGSGNDQGRGSNILGGYTPTYGQAADSLGRAELDSEMNGLRGSISADTQTQD